MLCGALVLAVLGVAPADTTLHFEGDVTAGDGDYDLVTFDVPAGTAEIEVDHASTAHPDDILDWGVWSPDGFRGWGGGLTDPAIIGEQASSRGYLTGPITSGTWTVVVGEAKLPNGTGHYTIDVTLRTAPTLAPQTLAPYTPVVLGTGARWYKGDFHVHDTQSGDASGTIDAIVALARAKGLDFVELSDHNTVAQDGLQAVAQAAQPDLLLLRGIEVTTYHGHGNAIGAAAYVDHRVGLGGVSAQTIADAVKAQGALFIVNHPALDLGDVCIGCAWAMTDTTPWDEVAGIEIQNGNVAVSQVLFTPHAIMLWDSLEDAGHHLAAMGGSDDHSAGQNESGTGSPVGNPTTLVWASELSEAAILDGVAHQRTEVLIPGPDTPIVDLAVATPGGDVSIGGTATGISQIVLTAHVRGAIPDGTTLGVYKDGVKIDQAIVDVASDFTHTFTYDAAGVPERYRAELESGGVITVITSHIYVDGDRRAAGCGCQGAPGAGGGAMIAFVALGLRPRRRTRGRAPRTR